jgi:hypothetical protein
VHDRDFPNADLFVRGFFFWFGATYLENSDCACNCCLFKHFVRRKTTNVPAGSNGRTRGYPGHHEDCTILDSNNRQVGYNAERAHRPEDGETLSCPPGNWDDAGGTLSGVNRPSSESPWKPTTVGDAIASGSWQTKNSCSWENGDFPFIASTWSWGKWDITWDFVGVIYDRCRFYNIERMTKMTLFIAGEGSKATKRKAVVTPIVPPGAPTIYEYNRLPGLTGTENELVRAGATRQINANS